MTRNFENHWTTIQLKVDRSNFDHEESPWKYLLIFTSLRIKNSSLSFLPETQSRWPRENCQNSFCRTSSSHLSFVVLHMYTYHIHQRVCKIYLRTNACPRGYCGGKMYISLWSSVYSQTALMSPNFATTFNKQSICNTRVYKSSQFFSINSSLFYEWKITDCLKQDIL